VRKCGWLVGLALLCGMGSSAGAQFAGDTELARNWHLRMGCFVPERKTAREMEGDVWLTIGAERPFYEADRWRGTVSVDYYGSGRIYSIPVSLNLRGESQRLRYGIGAGISVGHDIERGATDFAYNLLVGYTLRPGSNPISVDLRYMGIARTSAELNGWAVTLGYSF